MNLNQALKLIHGKRAILFTGAGFSFGAKSSRLDEYGKPLEFRSAKNISQELTALCGLDEDEGLGITSQYFREQKSDKELIDFLKREFTVTSISDSHESIGKIDWMRSYTTNYDEIIEESRKRTGNVLTSVTIDTDPRDYPDKKKVCVHLNGYIGNLTPATLDKEFKLTASSYSKDTITNSQWYDQFLEDLRSCDIIVFIGFSGSYDLDITRDLMSLKELRDKSIFIVGPTERPGAVTMLKNYGEVYKIGLDGFVKEWNATPEPINPPERIYKCFSRLPEIWTNTPWRSSDIRNLLWRGEVNDTLIHNAHLRYDSFPYVIFRQKVNHLLNHIEQGYSSFIVTAGLGNGKTLFLKEACQALQKKGWIVWEQTGDLSSVYSEIEDICQIEAKVAFVIDNSGERTHLLKTIKRHRNHDTLVILAERSARYEISFERYLEFDEEIINIDIDRLTGEEINRLVLYLNRHGLWGDKASLSEEEKASYIQKKCKGQIGKCMIGLIEDTHLASSFETLIKGIQTKSRFYKLFLYILCAKEYGFLLEYSDLWDVLGSATLNNSNVRKDPSMREIIDFEAEKICFNSSILAEHLLKHHINSWDIITFLKDLFGALEGRVNRSRKVKNQLKALMQYRTLAKITRDNAAIFDYYEHISQFQYCQTQPQFWLQYGIAKTANSDFDLARKYFDTAYALANIMGGYNTYQIDNHHAHMLFKEALQKDKVNEPMTLFREIHAKLTKRKKGDEERHYIYQVAQDYPKFWRKIANALQPSERAEFKRSCKEIIEFGQKFISRPNVNNKDMVKELISELQSIMDS